MARLIPEYAELHARSAFSLLDGASLPEALAERAREVGLAALAITDLDEMGGVVRFSLACEEHGVRPIFGAEVTLDDVGPVVLLTESAAGHASLARLISVARARPRGLPRVDLPTLASHASGLVCLTGGRGGALDGAIVRGGRAGARSLLGALSDAFPRALYVEVADHGLFDDAPRVARHLSLARDLDLPWVVAGDVRHARRTDKHVHDALVCLKRKTTIDGAGDALFPNDARCIASPAEVARAFREVPGGVKRTIEVAERCRFHVRELRPSLPRFPLPPGTDQDAYLEARVREGMRERWPSATDRHERQLRHELDAVREKELAGYFLVVWDIVRFARSRGILVQGRGSAANSAVCYCLGITAVDPIRLGLLFERFLGDGRAEPPDIDVDIAHQAREEVIRYVYERWGRDHAAMVAETVTFRARSAVRDAARVLGLPAEAGDRLANEVGGVPTDGPPDEAAAAADALEKGGLARAGLDPRDPRVRALVRLVRGLDGLPRHRSIHAGGFVLSADPLASLVPIESAAMAGRTVIQWDKDDIASIGLVKIDLLGLGILTVLGDAIALVEEHRGERIDLGRIPPDDPGTFEMIRAADTLGVFQIESRAQMATLPRMSPERFYDLVVQVAIIRPGPIQAEVVHPYLRRRRGEEPATCSHPSLEPILARTLGVPLFQEQAMRMAITVAGFSAARADELRRALGSKRDRRRVEHLCRELRRGMNERGIDGAVADEIVRDLCAFAGYGFPESHAASFALLVYASAYLKRHHAPELYTALLNAQPMGFYPLGSIVADAKRHAVEIRRPDVTRSRWNATLEPSSRGPHPLALRIGLRFVRGLGQRARDALARIAETEVGSIEELARRTALERKELSILARAGALDALARDRRRALFEVLRVTAPRDGPLAPRRTEREATLPALGEAETARMDWALLGVGVERHPMELLRSELRARGVPRIDELERRDRDCVEVAGVVTSRQRPATAKGFVFLSLEDESGRLDVVVAPRVYERYRSAVVARGVLLVAGALQHRHGALALRARHITPLRLPTA